MFDVEAPQCAVPGNLVLNLCTFFALCSVKWYEPPAFVWVTFLRCPFWKSLIVRPPTVQMLGLFAVSVPNRCVRLLLPRCRCVGLFCAVGACQLISRSFEHVKPTAQL